MTILRFIIFILLASIGAGLSAQSANQYLKEGDNFFEHGRYREALRYYKEGGTPSTWSKDHKMRAGICMYEINDVQGAISILDEIERDVNTPADVFFYLGRCFQDRHNFDRAIEYYKGFIRESKSNDTRRPWVKDEIMRCAYGKSAKYGEQNAYVENLGTSLNTFYDEFGPVPSPLYTDRLYFTSARSGSKGGLKDPNNVDDQKYGVYSADMYFSENQNGIWRAARPLDELNSTRNDIIYGFSSDGQQLFYYSGEQMLGGELVIDTFSVERPDNVVGTQLGPFDATSGDHDLFVFNDSIILFSSQRPGGFGGYDIYYSVLRNGAWTDAKNLGPKINSFYNEVSPYLTLNGRSLYFSSNRLNSLGGLDIFNTVFNDTLMGWTEVRNLGLPVNSAGNDAHFFVSADGLTGFFSSDRKSGFGQRDIYAAYMKQPIASNLTLSFPPTFIQLTTASDLADGNANEAEGTAPEQLKEYYVGDLLFAEDDVVLTPQNLKKLEVLTNLLLIYPTLRADLICHDMSEGPKSFDLYFSIKKSEEIADFLARKGINRDRLYIKGCGAFYPRTITPEGADRNPNLQRLNRRIEVNLYGTEGLPIAITRDNPNVPEEYVNPLAIAFRENHTGLVYRVQIASVSQLLQNEIFNQVENAMIQWDPATRTYKYFVGMETDYSEAQKVREDVRTRGFGDAFIVAHYNGKLVKSSDISMLAGDYPDLLLMERGE